jgi:FAD/FMN-containing dehydrogenase
VRPDLAASAAAAADRAPEPGAVAALADSLVDLLGPDGVGRAEPARRAASTDFAYLSPVLAAALPGRPADLVAYPRTPAEIASVAEAAARHGVPVTPRGKGTGNYGQAVPLAGGLVVDASRADRVLDVGPGKVRVAAGAPFTAVEAVAREHGQELALVPTTVSSAVGGFIGGGAGGLGSVGHGLIWDGFVHAVDVWAPATGVATLTGTECGPVLHAYGVTGVITEATVALVPARDWVALLASAETWTDAVDAARALTGLDPVPRLVSVDEPNLIAAYPTNPAMPAGRYSVRALVDVSTVDVAGKAVAGAGGRVEAVRPESVGYVTSLGFNHVTMRARRARPELCHLQVGGPALLDRVDEVRAVLPGTMLHLDAMRGGFGGLLLSEFTGPDALYEGIDRLRALGVAVVDPHTWLVGGPALPAVRSWAAKVDPTGLLNPGKLPLL